MRCSTGFLGLVMLLCFTGCKPQTYDDCLENAAKDAKSVAALEVLKGVCERAHAAERVVIPNAGKADQIFLTPPLEFLLAGVNQQRVTRSTLERTESGIKASIEWLSPAIEMKAQLRRAFDPDGQYDAIPEVQVEQIGVREFDCDRKRARWLDLSMKLYIGNKSEPEAVLRLADQDFENMMVDEAKKWSYITDEGRNYDFDYVCFGRINPDVIHAVGYENICGSNYKGTCKSPN